MSSSAVLTLPDGRQFRLEPIEADPAPVTPPKRGPGRPRKVTSEVQPLPMPAAGQPAHVAVPVVAQLTSMMAPVGPPTGGASPSPRPERVLPEPIAYRLDDLAEMGPLGRSSLYKLIREGKLAARKSELGQ